MESENLSNFDIDLEEPTSEDVIKWAKEHIGENPDTKCQFLANLRDLIYGNLLNKALLYLNNKTIFRTR